MIEIVVALAASLAAAAGSIAVFYHMKRHDQHYQTVSIARQLHLSMDGDTARGNWNGHPMEVRIRDLGNQGTDILLRVGGADPRFRIIREPMRLFRRPPPPPGPFLPISMSDGYREPDDIVTGDEEFDAQIRVKGPVGVGVGILDRETRRLIQGVNALGAHVADGALISMGSNVHVEEGWIVVKGRDIRIDDTYDIVAWLKLMAELAEALARRGKARPIDNLAGNFRAERDPEVRRVNLACLGAYFPDDPETLEVSRKALTDPESDWIRLQGAVNLRREGWPALREMIVDFRRLDGVRAAALRALGLSLPAEEAESLLLGHLDSEIPALALSAAETLGDRGRTFAVAARLDAWAAGRSDKAESRVARKAAEKVRLHLEGAESGGLSLAITEEEGRLSKSGGGPPVKSNPNDD